MAAAGGMGEEGGWCVMRKWLSANMSGGKFKLERGERKIVGRKGGRGLKGIKGPKEKGGGEGRRKRTRRNPR